MMVRVAACVVMGLLLSGCPFALEDDYFIDDTAAPAPTVPQPPPPTDAGRPDAGNDCLKKGPCRGDECRGTDCLKFP